MQHGRYLELSSWKRREHFDLFRQFASPFFNVSVELDATATWKACKAADSPSFYVAILFHSLNAANSTEAFRMRIRGDRVWIHDQVRASATILRDDETFGFGLFPPSATLREFDADARGTMAKVKRVTPLVLPRPGEDDLIYHSALPWMRLTAFSNALRGGEDSVPRVVLGKCGERDGRWLLPVAVEVHHALVDGLDVARYFERLQQGLSADSP